MKHMTLPRFWRHYQQLSEEIQALADKQAAQGRIAGDLLQHVSPCWTAPSYAPNYLNAKVLINVSFNRDGTLAADPEIAKYPASATGAAVASAAMRAIKRCVTADSPVKLPPDLYDFWKEMEVPFDPYKMP